MIFETVGYDDAQRRRGRTGLYLEHMGRIRGRESHCALLVEFPHIVGDDMQRIVRTDALHRERRIVRKIRHFDLPVVRPVEDVDEHFVIVVRPIIPESVFCEVGVAGRRTEVRFLEQTLVQVVSAELVSGVLADAFVVPAYVAAGRFEDLVSSGRPVAADMIAGVIGVPRPPPCSAYGGDIVFAQACW